MAIEIDPRLDEINDCLYRVATKAFIIHDDKILLVKEIPRMYWGFPGGGIDHGENVSFSLKRELNEEIGVPIDKITSDFKIAYFTIGSVVEKIPRMNMFYRVSLPKDLIKQTEEVAAWDWFTKKEFMTLNLSPSFSNREEMAQVIFGS